MKEDRLDCDFERIYKQFTFLWENYHFHLAYLTRDYGVYYQGFIIGLENDVCKIIFEKETNSPVESIALNIGKKISPFAPPNYLYFVKDGWHPLTGLIYWLSGTECERYDNVDQDLESVSQYLKLNIDKLLDLFKSSEDFDSKLEDLKNLHKDEQITVEKLRAERARLYALGQDYSVEAAIASLRGGKK